ncbi:MAG TPA: cyclase family protein [Vicinamibacterales bacterium]|nr:cyclase family protein [Vicinamibacterales bacterium]
MSSRDRHRCLVAAAAAVMLSTSWACGESGSPPRPAVGGESPRGRLLDMTYVFDAGTIYWPNARGFELDKGQWGTTAGGYFYSANDYSAAEHGGTHLDAPIHFAEGGRTVDQIPLEELVGPAVRVDVTAACARNRNYLLQVDDLTRWEAAHGRIPERAWVIMYTGIGTRHYPDRKQVLGTDIQGEAAIPHLTFPGFSPESARWLLEERDIIGVAIDTPSIDYGRSQDFQVHRLLYGAGKVGLENIANLDKLPAAGATLYAAPMPIKDGTGAPARVFAVLPQ